MDLETIDLAVFNSGLNGIGLNLLVQNMPDRERWRDGSAGANGSTPRLTRALYSMSQWLSLGAQHAPHGGAAIALTRRASSACCGDKTAPEIKAVVADPKIPHDQTSLACRLSPHRQ